MTVLTSITGTQNYFDTDGLLRRYGTDKAYASWGGEFKTYGDVCELEFNVDLTSLTTTAQIIDEQVFLPKNCYVESVQFVATGTITSGGSGTISMGIVKTSTRDSADATDAALISTLATPTTGVVTTLFVGVPSVGSVVGTNAVAAATPQYITMKVSSTYSAGKAHIRIRYRTIQ